MIALQTGTNPYSRVAAQSRRDALILEHLGLVRHVCGRLLTRLPSGTDRENLEAAGLLGLVEAAGHFDPERGVKFETYATTRIRGAVLDELRRNCPLPQQMLEKVARVRKAHEELPPPVTPEMLAEATGLTVEEVADCLAAQRLTRQGSWEEALESRVAPRDEGPEAQALRAEEKELLAAAIKALPERERLAVTLYHLEDLRLKEIGELLGLSESRVSRLLTAALFSLGEYLRARGQ